MKKIIFIMFCLIVFADKALASEIITNCSNLPSNFGRIISLFYKIIKYAVPILIIVIASIDLIKYVVSSDNDMLSKAMKNFGKKLFAGCLVFVLFILFQTVLRLVSNNSTIFECMNCLLVDNSICQYSEKDDENDNNDPISGGKDNNKPGDNPGTTETPIDKNDIWFIGDSRTVGMCDTNNLCKNNNTSKVGAGYGWFTTNTKTSSKTVIVLMGVNGAGKTTESGKAEANKYISQITQLKKGEWKNKNIIFVSVNPVVDGKSSTYTAAVKGFNSVIKSSSVVKCCNTIDNVSIDPNYDKSMGLHYSSTDYQKIYNYIIGKCL